MPTLKVGDQVLVNYKNPHAFGARAAFRDVFGDAPNTVYDITVTGYLYIRVRDGRILGSYNPDFFISAKPPKTVAEMNSYVLAKYT